MIFTYSEAQQKESNLIDKVSSLESQLLQFTEEKNSAINKEELKSENLSLHFKVAEFTSQLKSRKEENILLVSKSEEMEAKLKNLEENYGQQKDGFVEELNKMNDVLKQRGETITRLEEKNQTSEKEFKVKNIIPLI